MPGGSSMRAAIGTLILATSIFIALALGQILIGWVEVGSSAPFNAIVVLFALALLMVSTTRAEPPSAAASEPLPWGQLSRAAPVAVLGSLANGFVSGSFYALVPAWLERTFEILTPQAAALAHDPKDQSGPDEARASRA